MDLVNTLLHGFGQHTAHRLPWLICVIYLIGPWSTVHTGHRACSVFFSRFFPFFSFFSFLFVFFVFSSFFPFVMIGPRSTQSTVAIPVSMKQSSVEVSRLRWQAPALTLATEIDFVGRQPRRRFQVQ